MDAALSRMTTVFVESGSNATLVAECRCMVVQIIETKVKKLEQLVRLKDAKIQTLIAKMQAAGLA